MPVNVVKTPRDERLWRKAKAVAKKRNRAKDWKYVMGIYKRMKGIKESIVEGVRALLGKA